MAEPKTFDVLAKPSREFIQRNQDKWTLEGFLQSSRDHVGKTLDAGHLPELVLDGGCAYFGARAAANIRAAAHETPSPEDLFGGVVIGLLGRRLATAFGGTPPVAQIVGLAMLASIGLIDLAPDAKALLDSLGYGPIPGLPDPFAAGFDLAKKLTGK